MKAFLTITLVVVFQFYNTNQQTTSDPATFDQLFKASLAECLKENNLEEPTVLKIFSQPDFPANDKPLQCFYNCLNLKLGVTDAAGNLNDQQFILVNNHYETATQVQEINDECKNLKPSGDLCEFGYLLMKCVAEAKLD